MKLNIRFFFNTMFLLVLVFALEAFAQVASPTPGAAAPAASGNFFDWIAANKMAFGACVYWVLDVLILLIPGLQGNGLLHQIQLIAGKMSGQNWGQ